jgi:hypothetical protein
VDPLVGCGIQYPCFLSSFNAFLISPLRLEATLVVTASIGTCACKDQLHASASAIRAVFCNSVSCRYDHTSSFMDILKYYTEGCLNQMSSLTSTYSDVVKEYGQNVTVDNNFVSFVAKTQKVKTRKDKEYFVLRVNIPKNVAERVGIGPGDYLLLRAKKAKWFHMIDWTAMQDTWRMLPDEVKKEIVFSGLPNPGVSYPISPTYGNIGLLGCQTITSVTTRSQTAATELR